MSYSNVMKTVKIFTKKNAPVIATTLAIASATASVVFAAKAGMTAKEKLDELKKSEKDLKTSDKIKATWKIYIPTALMLTSTIVSITTLHRVGVSRETSALALFKASETAFSQYRNKVVEKLGESDEKKVREEVITERIAKNPPTNEVIVVSGDVLVFDVYSGRYFQSSMTKIDAAVNEFNRKVIHEGYASLTEFYDLIGLEPNGSSDDVGWMSDALLEVSYSSVLTPDGSPCLAVDFRTTPVLDYDRMA